MKTNKEILRPQWDARKRMWKIVKANPARSGWQRYGGKFYHSREEALESIERIVAAMPLHYEIDVRITNPLNK